MGDNDETADATVIDLTQHPRFHKNLFQRITVVAITLKRELTGDMDLFADIAVSTKSTLSTDWLCGLTFCLVVRDQNGQLMKFDDEYSHIKQLDCDPPLYRVTIGPLREAEQDETAQEDKRLSNRAGILIIRAGKAERHFPLALPTP